MGTFLQDLKFAFRSLRKTPAFPLAAIATLALGIGATTAIFSTVNAVLLQPLPYPKPENLYALRTTLTDGRVTTGLVASSEIYRLKDAPSIEHAAALQQVDVTLLRDDGTPQHVFAYGVSDDFFEVFGLPMTLGGISHDAPGPNATPTAIISYRVWQDLYHGDPAVIGTAIHFAEVTTTISGVAPKNFDTPHNGDYWFRQPLDPAGLGHVNDGYIRLRPGTTLQRAQSELGIIMDGLARDFPASAKSRAYVVHSLVASIVGDLGPILLIVLSATALLLILACVNVTNLLLARGAARAREMAVRVALGAGRRRIVRQLLTESVLLATAGAIVGLLVASLGVRLLLSVGASKLPRLETVSFDTNVLTFALLALVASGVLVGFAPALRLAGTDVRTLMNESGRSAGGGRSTARWLSAMTVAEIALAITLVAGAGWLIRSFASLKAIDPGFVADRRVIFDVALRGPRYPTPASVVTAYDEIAEHLRALPGVVAAGSTSNFPLRGTIENSLILQFKGEPLDPVRPMGTRQRVAGLGFFPAMGIKVVSGRDFSVDDRQGTRPVVVVNRTFVLRYLPNRDPLGVQFASGYPNINPSSMVTIVGVVDDVRQRTLVDAAEPAFYSTTAQFSFDRQTFVVQARTEPTPQLLAAIRDEVRKIDPQVPVDFQPVDELVRSTLRRQELGMTLMLLFGAVAVALAAIGIYGVVAYAAAQRRNEVATRLALGASSGHVFWLVLRQGMTLAAAGTAIGLVIASLSGRIVSNTIYAVQAFDPLILLSATIIVVGIALLATMIPAFRASRLDPSRVLRPE